MSVRSVSPDSCVLGIDDTDMPGIGGTGQLARRLAREIEQLELGRAAGVTRHQLFEGPGVPKTSRNSAAAIGLGRVTSPEKLLEAACDVVSREAVAGSDPGVAIGWFPLDQEVTDFAQRAQTGLVRQRDARHLAKIHSIELVGLGGSEDGVIGALAAIALRTGGNDGRFVGLAGIREVSGAMSVEEILDSTAISDVVDAGGGRSLAPGTLLDLGDWVRPRLLGGKPVLVARRSSEGWVNADSRSK
jgi:hypothetical protein